MIIIFKVKVFSFGRFINMLKRNGFILNEALSNDGTMTCHLIFLALFKEDTVGFADIVFEGIFAHVSSMKKGR